MKKRTLSMLLALIMLISLLPVSALAADEPAADAGTESGTGTEPEPEVTVPAANQASDITISGLTLTPAFDPGVYEYTLPDQVYNKGSVYVKVTVAEGNMLAGKLKNYDTEKEVKLTSGKNQNVSTLVAGTNTIEITVTPAEGTELEPTTYTISVKRTPAMTKLALADSEGNTIPMNRNFAISTTEGYTAEMPAGAALKMTPTMSHAASTNVMVKAGEGEYALHSAEGYAIAEGENVFKLKTVSKDGTIEGNEYTLTVTGVATTSHTVTIPTGAGLDVTDPNGNVVAIPEGAEADGTVTYTLDGLMSGKDYDWSVGKYGYNAKGGSFVAGGEPLSVELSEADKPSSDLEAQWKNFRNSDNHMAIVTQDLPLNADEAAQKWVTEESFTRGTGTNMNNPSPMLIVDNKLITTCASEILQLSLEDGTILKRGDMVDYNGVKGNAAPVYGGGMIFMPLNDGRVQAFDAKTLESLWVSESLGTQCTTSLVYDEGYIYGSTGNAAPGRIFCIQAADEDPDSDLETKYATWMIHDKANADKGSYWSTPYITENAVVYGTDSGYLYSRNKQTGEVITMLSLDNGGKTQRSGLSYYNGRIYGGDHAKNLFSVAIDENGVLSDLKKQSFDDERKLLSKITSTPVICDGVVFFGGSKQLLAADAETLELITSTGVELFANVGTIESSPIVKKGEDGNIYLYFTHNAKPGALYVAVYDTEAQTLTPSALYTPEADKQQLVITSPICDEEGTIYYRNDSGYIFAVSKWEGENCPVVIAAEPVGASIVVKDTEGTEQTAVSTGIYDLAAGEYSYTVSLSGYITASGTVTISEDESANHTTKRLNVELEKVPAPKPDNDTIKVYISVKDPQGETYFGKTRFTVDEGTTVFELLEMTGLDITSSESDLGVYVEAIEGLAEFDEGAGSGWMYRVGELFPQASCGTHELENGDYVEWLYTRNFGEDIGDDRGGSSNKPKEEEEEVLPEVIPEADFSDTKDHWASESINYVVSKGLMKGTSDKDFDPEGKLNRAMLVTLLYRLEGEPEVESSGGFTDVDGESWYAKAVLWATENGIVNGLGDGLYGPMNEITREQMAAMLLRYTQFKKYDSSASADLKGFADAGNISYWAKDALEWANAAGLISGRSEDSIAPLGGATRAECATILMRYLENIAD